MGWLFMPEMVGVASRQRTFGCCELTVLKVCDSVRNFYIFSVYRSPSINDKIYDCLLEAMAKVQSMD